MKNSVSLLSPFISTTYKGQIFRSGERVSVDRGMYHHIGTVGYDNCIFAASPTKGVEKVSFDTFSKGSLIENIGHIGTRRPADIINTYYQLIGKKYNWRKSNCEHYDNYARGLGWRSEQIERLEAIGDTAIDCAMVGALFYAALRANPRP